VERLVAWYRVGSSVGAVVALVVANAIPLIGVVFLGWSVWNILVIYWLENGIVGVLNVLKMARAEGPTLEGPGPMTFQVNGRPASTMAKAALIPFFVLHYGIFWFVHGIFVFTLPLFASISAEPLATPMTLSAGSIAFAAVALAVSHGLSYWWNFLRGGEYRRVSAAGQMFAPYRRLIALHLTIKTLLDLGLHLSEHRPPATSGATIAN
jgi:Family of unknown function (DUF6498)